MASQRIMIVEDEPHVSETLRRVLSLPDGGGYEVECYGSGEPALARFQEMTFDLVITDLRMPGMSGLELLEQIHKISPGTRSILITAFGTPQVEDRAHRLADAFLPKPFKMRSLLETVQQTLNVAPAVSPRLIAFSEDGLRAIQQRMESLRLDLAALGVLLLDQSGQLLTETGRRGDFDTNAFLALLGNAMAAANEVAHMLKDQAAFDLHFHEGGKYEIYTVRISDQVFLCLVLARNGASSRIGMVWLYLRRAITELRELLAHATIAGSTPLDADLRSAVGEALEEAVRLADDLGKPPATTGPGESLGQAANPPVNVPKLSTSTGSGEELLSFEEARERGLVNLDFLKE